MLQKRSTESANTEGIRDPKELRKNNSTNDILDDHARRHHNRMAQEIRSKDEKLASITLELECLNKECKQLKQDNDDLVRGVNKLKDELSAQELLVRLERGDYEELKEKERKLTAVIKENQELHSNVQKLQLAATGSSQDRSHLDQIERELETEKKRHAKAEKKLQSKIDEINRQHQVAEKENREAVQKIGNITVENKQLQFELKNALRSQTDLEKQIKKLQVSDSKMSSEKDREIDDLRENVAELEKRLAEVKSADMEMRAKDQEIASLKVTVDTLNANDRNKDEIIEQKEQSIQNLRYKLKDAQETYESQWEEMMMMTERQLKAVRAEKSDTAATKQLKTEIRALQSKLQNKEDEKSALSKEITDMKRKLNRLENESRVPKAKFDEIVTDLKTRLSEAEDRLKDETYARMEEKRILETKIKNLQGHMISIYTGHVPLEMAKMLDQIVKLRLEAQTN